MKNKKILIPVIISAVVVVLGIVAFLFRGAIVNAYVSLLPAEKQLKIVYENAAEKLAENGGTFVDQLNKNMQDVQKGTASGNLSVEVDSALLKQLLGMDLGDVNQVSLDYEIVQNSDEMGVGVGLGIEDTEIANADISLNLAESFMTLYIPEFSQKALKTEIDAEEVSEELKEAEKVTKLMKAAIPNSEFVKKFIPKYIDTVVSCFDKAEKEKTTVQAGYLSQKATAITVVLDANAMTKMSGDVLAQLRTDMELKQYLKKVYEFVVAVEEEESEDWNEIYEDFLKEIQEGFDDIIVSDEITRGMEFITWLNSKNEIIGVKLGTYGSYVNLRDDEKVASEFIATEDGKELARITLNGQITNMAFTGTLDIRVEDEKPLTINIDNYTAAESKASCSMSVKLTEDMIEELTEESWDYGSVILKLQMDSENTTSNIKLAAIANEKEWVKIKINSNYDANKTKVEYPTNVTEDIEQWDGNFEEIQGNLIESGLPEDLVQQLLLVVYYSLFL